MNSLNRDREEEQLRIISKCPPELLEIVGKHSTLWNYGKLETVEKLADLIEEAKAEEKQRCLEALPKKREKWDNTPHTIDGYTCTDWGFNYAIDQAISAITNKK